MRTTLDLDDILLLEARKTAKEEGISLTAFIESSLAHRLSLKAQGEQSGYRFEWKSRDGKPNANIDIADRDLLYDHMEGRL